MHVFFLAVEARRVFFLLFRPAALFFCFAVEAFFAVEARGLARFHREKITIFIQKQKTQIFSILERKLRFSSQNRKYRDFSLLYKEKFTFSS